MDRNKIRELEEKIAEVKARIPAHSVQPAIIMELEDLEEQLAKAREEMKSGDQG